MDELILWLRYEELEAGGFLDLEWEPEDNEDLLWLIQEEEQLCAFYEYAGPIL